MKFTEHSYIDAGYKAAKATWRGESLQADAYMAWFKRALSEENPEDREQAQKLWGKGFREAGQSIR